MVQPNDTTWTIDGIVVDGLSGPTPTFTRGQSVPLTLIFEPIRSVAADDYDVRYRALREYLGYANGASISKGITNSGKPYFHEEVSPDAPIDSFVLPIEPGADVIDAVGFWALLLNGEDKSEPVADQRRLKFNVFVLAERDEYADKQAIVDDLGSPVI